MTDSHAAACDIAANALEKAPSGPVEILVGLDGFVDHIIDVVDTRSSPTDYQRVATIAALGERISAAAGRSMNLELVITTTKIGGNGPIMANALAAQGAAVDAVGLLGEGGIVEPVFAELADRAARVVSLGPASVSDALEFDDGKIMLGKHQSLGLVTYDGLVEACGGVDGLRDLLRTPRGIATTNWTMLLGMTDIWKRMAEEILPGLRADRPWWFIDLADPAKRTRADQRAALETLEQIEAHARVVLGLNEAELRQMLDAVGLDWNDEVDVLTAAEEGCVALREATSLSVVMCHRVQDAACAWDGGSVKVNGFFEPKPKITTGAGDHFNAGFFGAWLREIDPRSALLVGGATSGSYVRSGHSPTRDDVVEFLRSYHGRADAGSNGG